jgi:hypothetical protein
MATVAVFLPGFEVIEGQSAGSFKGRDDGTHIGVLHTTQGSSLSSALGAFRDNNSWPHITCGGPDRVKIQHLSLDVPARALFNTSAGGRTNREPLVVQIEILGRAEESHDWPEEYLEWLGSEVVGPVARAVGIPLTTSVTFFGEDAGFVLAEATSRQRLSAEAYDTYAGWLGHQHVPENKHWDPGKLDVQRIFAAAGGSPSQGGLTMADINDIIRRLDEIDLRVTQLQQEVVAAIGPDGDSRMDRLAQRIDAISAAVGATP